MWVAICCVWCIWVWRKKLGQGINILEPALDHRLSDIPQLSVKSFLMYASGVIVSIRFRDGLMLKHQIACTDGRNLEN